MKTTFYAFLFGGPGASTKIGDLGLALVRIFFGFAIAFGHGIHKIESGGHFGLSDQFYGAVRSMGFPAPLVFAWLSALSEFGCGILLILGLMTRPASLALTINMFVAAFVALGSAPLFADSVSPKEVAILYLAVYLMLTFTGAGRFAVDRYLR
jgi:putative oxidoreductase